MRATALLAAVGLALQLSNAIGAGSYPVKPVRVVVGFAPGGSVDVVARLVSQKLGEAFGHQLLVDNRAGAAGNIAAELVAKSPRDGYTLLLGTSAALVVNVHIYSKLPYDPRTDFAPIAQLVNQQNVLVVNPSVPARTVADFIALARQHPGKLTFGSNGVGSSQHMSAELFMAMTRVRMTDVPYKGGSLAITELVGGHIDSSFAVVPTALPLVQSGKLRALAVTATERSAMMPDVPTLHESGLTGYSYGNWMGLLGPADMPRDIVLTLNSAVNHALAGADLRRRLTELGLDVAAAGTPEKFGQFVRDDMAKHAALFKNLGDRLPADR